MLKRLLGIWAILMVAAAMAAAGDDSKSPARLSAADIASRNVAARGGLQAWRAVQTLSLSGKLGAGGNQRATLEFPTSIPKAAASLPRPRPAEEVQLPFLMELERPRKIRFELQFNGQTAVQVYDGAHGWKLRPFLNRLQVEPYTAEELKIASTQADLDGFLVDYAAKGTRIELEGVEKVEDRNDYRLKLTLKTGRTLHLWVDSETFLETKIEGQPRRLDGTDHPIEVYFRDYRPVGGLKIPYLLETKVLPVGKTTLGLRDTPIPTERIIIENVLVNPKLDESRFAKPDARQATVARNRAS